MVTRLLLLFYHTIHVCEHQGCVNLHILSYVISVSSRKQPSQHLRADALQAPHQHNQTTATENQIVVRQSCVRCVPCIS